MPSYHNHLFHLIAKGDTAAFQEAFHIYAPGITGYILRLLKKRDLAEDLVQEVFLILWQKRSGLPDIDNPEGWLRQVALNLCRNEFRRQWSRLRFLNIYEEFIPPHNVDEQLHRKQLAELLEEGIRALTHSRRDILMLSWQKELSRNEIAALLGISPHTVKNQLAAAIRFLHEYIRKNTGMYLPVSLLLSICNSL